MIQVASERHRGIATALAVVLICFISACAGDHRAAAEPAKAAPGQSSSLYKRLMSRYEQLGTYQATIQSLTTLQPVNGTKPNTIDSTLNVSYKAPNLFRIDAQGLMGGGTRVSDGKTLYTYSAMLNQYSAEAAPKDLFSELMAATADAPAMKAVGRAVIDRVATTQYSGSSATAHGAITYDVYINDASRLIQRIVIREPALPGPQGADFHLILREDYVTQKLNPVLPANLFHFDPPAGAQKADSAQIPSITGYPG